MFSDDTRRRLAPLPLALVLAIAAFAWFGRLNAPVFPINDDSIRDQLLVRDCTDLDACHLLGALSSFGDLFHGAVWIDLLTAVRLLGGDLAAQRVMVLAALALSAATLFIVVWQWLRPSMALPAALLLIASLSFETPATLLINPSMAVFPDLLTAAGLLCYGLSRQRRFLVAAAFSLGVAISMHTASFSLTVPFVIVVCVARPPAWRYLILGVAIAGITFAIPSSAALRANVLALAKHGLLLPMLAAAVVLVPFALACGARFRSLGWNARAGIVGVLLTFPFAMILVWLVRRHHFSTIYVHPVLAPGAVMAAAILTLPCEGLARWAWPLRWMPTTAAAVVAAVAAFNVQWFNPPGTSDSNDWTIAKAAVVSDEAARRGWSYGDLVFHLQGSACRELLAGMSMVAPAPRAAPEASRRQLQVLHAHRDAFASSDQVIVFGSHAVLMREIDSWLQPRLLKACRVPPGGGTPVCAAATAVTADAQGPEHFLFLARTFSLIESLDAQQRPYVATYEIPLQPTEGERVLAVVDDHASRCGWRITRVEGVQVDAPLPARRVRLRAASGGRGLIVFEKPFGTSECPPSEIDAGYPPCVLETMPDDPLQNLVGHS